MPEVNSINWVICPKSKHRFYVSAQLLLVDEILAICPRCRHEFDAKSNVEPRFSEVTGVGKWL